MVSKIKLFLVTIICSSVSFFASAQDEKIQEAPLNPAFVEYMTIKNLKALAPEVTPEGFYLGLIPSTVQPDFSAFEAQISTQKSMQTLPAVYDMRTNGRITPVKNQGQCGSCWLFPTMGSVESYWKVLGLSDFDLAEDNLKNCHGFDYLPCEGGSRDMATSYFSRSTGPYLESQDPYTAASAGCPSGLTPTAYVSQARFLPKNKNVIKQALMDYGAIYNTFHWEAASYRASDYTYYYNGTSNTLNHAVLIVGWDDNKVTAGGTGAWIIKNSWGTSWGQSGFFYISYNDTKATSDATYYPGRVDYDVNSKISYYDHLGMTTSMGFGSSTAYGMVKYVPAGNEQLTKIGTWVAGSNATVTIEVYNTLSGTTLSALLGSIPAKTCALPGYYTFDLNSAISVSAGNDYFIKIKYTTPGYNFPIPVESKIAGLTNNAVIESGNCWISSGGYSWTAVGSNTTKKYDVCIKAYSKMTGCTPITIATASPAIATACLGGSVTYSVNPSAVGNTYQWKVSTNGTTWTNLTNGGNYSNVNTNTLTINAIIASLHNKKYRCVVSNTCSTVNSSIVTLTTNKIPVVSSQTGNKSITQGSNTTFTFSATGTGKTYQWQVSSNNGSTWTNITNGSPYSNATGLTLKISQAPIALSGKKYRCVVTNYCGTVNTNGVTLTVSPSLLIILEDNSARLLITDEDVMLSVDGTDLEEKPFILGNNYPNPFSQYTRIDYNLSEDAAVTLEIYNLLGRQVAVLVNDQKAAGNYQIEFDGSDLPAGYYTYTLKASSKNKTVSQTRTMVVVKE
ncbi:MAG: C1 family peptidase [Bacteroidota bacterium]|nr:C1 family peptidase [Bacteroidota bacterium]